MKLHKQRKEIEGFKTKEQRGYLWKELNNEDNIKKYSKEDQAKIEKNENTIEDIK